MKKFNPRVLMAVLLTAGAVLLPRSLAAQDPAMGAWQAEESRTRLEALLSEYEQRATSPAQDADSRIRARETAEQVRTRLQHGDFHVGDQVVVEVEHEDTLSGTFIVQPGPQITLPVVGPVALQGVLRSELEPLLRNEIARYIRDPEVEAHSAIRVVVTGGVGKPGYLVVPTTLSFAELFTMAGGTAGTAELTRIRVERGSETIWKGEALQEAIIQGRTVDQLSIRAGDHIVVPVREKVGTWTHIRNAAMIVTPLAVLIRLMGDVL